MKNALITTFTLALAGGAICLQSQADDFRYQADWDSIRSHYKCPEWFRDAKFGMMWFDFGLDKPGFESVHKRILAYYYNKGLEWKKGVVFQDKNMKSESFPEDLIVLDIERGRMEDINPRPWQADTSIGKISWGYIDNEDYKTSDYLLDEPIDISGKDEIDWQQTTDGLVIRTKGGKPCEAAYAFRIRFEEQ